MRTRKVFWFNAEIANSTLSERRRLVEDMPATCKQKLLVFQLDVLLFRVKCCNFKTLAHGKVMFGLPVFAWGAFPLR